MSDFEHKRHISWGMFGKELWTEGLGRQLTGPNNIQNLNICLSDYNRALKNNDRISLRNYLLNKKKTTSKQIYSTDGGDKIYKAARERDYLKVGRLIDDCLRATVEAKCYLYRENNSI